MYKKHEIIEVLTSEPSRIGNCLPETITVMFAEVLREDWGRNGRLFIDHYKYGNEAPTT